LGCHFEHHVHPCLCRGAVSDAGVAPLSVVENLDVFEECRLCLVPRPELCSVNHFGFQRAEEALHRGVVEAVPLAAHRGRHVMKSEQFPVAVAGILHPPVGVDDQPRRGPPVADGHLQRVLAQGAFQALRHRPANDLHGGQVLDRREIEPALVRRDVGDICEPDGVRHHDLEVAAQHVGCNRKCMAAIRGHGHAPLASRRVDTVLFHQLGNRFL